MLNCSHCNSALAFENLCQTDDRAAIFLYNNNDNIMINNKNKNKNNNMACPNRAMTFENSCQADDRVPHM